MIRLLLLAIVVIATSADARVRAVRHRGGIPAPPSLMWIAAHPDDEAVIAPLLEKWCVQGSTRCTLVILTRGEAGPCLLPDGCQPDVASVRSAEAAAAAQRFRAELVLLQYPDGGGIAPPTWNEAELLPAIARIIETVRPELVLTFDPRHGTTCHPDHRETGRLVAEAVRRVSYEPRLSFLETRVRIAEPPLMILFAPAMAHAERFDATTTWHAVVEDMERHPSQFPAEWIDAIRAVPRNERFVYLAPAAFALEQPVSGCPDN